MSIKITPQSFLFEFVVDIVNKLGKKKENNNKNNHISTSVDKW